MNIKTTSLEEQIAQLLRTIDQPARLRILMAIGHSEACVYYRLSDPHLLDLIQLAGSMTGVDENTMQTLIQSEPFPLCECPNCAAELQAAEGSS